mmetsp:Transcript_13011/g.19742  ORF Transcript_13011/g.19742 Transcript_13011/m.19742 type:complete len:135 (+) Transcript_13011:67-471(+)
MSRDYVWFTPEHLELAESPVQQQQHLIKLKEEAIKLLKDARIEGVRMNQIIFVPNGSLGTDDLKHFACRYHALRREFYVNDALLEEMDFDEEDEEELNLTAPKPSSRAYLLGYYIAQEHPDGQSVVNYLLKHRK